MFAFDLETTGTDPLEDRIVEIAWMDLSLPAYSAPSAQRQLIDPGVPIPEQAQEIHGISDADVADAPSFDRESRYFQERVNDAEFLLTYNGRSFDTLMLDAELRRAGREGIDLEAVREIDLYRVWKELEPRTLSGAVQRFAPGLEHDAHDAGSDVEVLFEVMGGIGDELLQRQDSGGLERLCELSVPDHEVDRSGRLIEVDGEVCFGFGKNRGEPVTEHPDYVDWMLRADFPPDTKEVLRELEPGS